MSCHGRGFDPALDSEFRRRLLDARTALLQTAAATDEEIAGLERPGPGDAPDRAASAATTSLVTRLGGQEKRELDEISDALRRLGAGRFGACESCHKPIPLVRLRALPAARFCRSCQAAQEAVR
jgi:DnaK suppressor protein